MRKILTPIFLMLMLTQFLNGQDISKKDIVEKYGLDTIERVLYVIGGVPYEEIELDSVLNLYRNEHLVDILMFDDAIKTALCTSVDCIVMVFTHQQTRTEIKEKLSKLRDEFPDNCSNVSQDGLMTSENSVLYIDDKKIHYLKAKEAFDKLTVSDIYYIDYKNEAERAEFYGDNIKNGVVRIWTKHSEN